MENTVHLARPNHRKQDELCPLAQICSINKPVYNGTFSLLTYTRVKREIERILERNISLISNSDALTVQTDCCGCTDKKRAEMFNQVENKDEQKLIPVLCIWKVFVCPLMHKLERDCD